MSLLSALNPIPLLRGESLGQTIYNTLAAVALIGALAFVGVNIVSGKFWKWRAHTESTRADQAEQSAATAQGNADSANAGAANASQTRDRMDSGKLEIHITAEQAAGRVERYESIDADATGALPADLVRELDAARDRAGAASDRLRRKGGG